MDYPGKERRAGYGASSASSAPQISWWTPSLIKRAPTRSRASRWPQLLLAEWPRAAFGSVVAIRSGTANVHPSSRTLRGFNRHISRRGSGSPKLFDANQRHTWLSGATLTQPWSKRPSEVAKGFLSSSSDLDPARLIPFGGRRKFSFAGLLLSPKGYVFGSTSFLASGDRSILRKLEYQYDTTASRNMQGVF